MLEIGVLFIIIGILLVVGLLVVYGFVLLYLVVMVVVGIFKVDVGKIILYVLIVGFLIVIILGLFYGKWIGVCIYKEVLLDIVE